MNVTRHLNLIFDSKTKNLPSTAALPNMFRLVKRNFERVTRLEIGLYQSFSVYFLFLVPDSICTFSLRLTFLKTPHPLFLSAPLHLQCENNIRLPPTRHGHESNRNIIDLNELLNQRPYLNIRPYMLLLTNLSHSQTMPVIFREPIIHAPSRIK